MVPEEALLKPLVLQRMTRFARSAGSKASNKREPEEATPWGTMVQGVRAQVDFFKIFSKKLFVLFLGGGRRGGRGGVWR